MKNELSSSTQKRMVSGAAVGRSQESASSRRALGLAPGPRGWGGRRGIRRQTAGEPKGRRRRIAEWRSMAFWAAAALSVAAARGEVVDAHRVAEWRFAVTNGTEAVQTVEGVRVSCPCLKTEDIAGREVAPGEALEFGVSFDPTGLEGRVLREAEVRLVPSGEVQRFVVDADVRVRLGLGGGSASFGVVEDGEVREVRLELRGYAAQEARITGVEGPERAVFRVEAEEDGRGVRVTAPGAGERLAPGTVAETWTVRTDDAEVPEIRLPASAVFSGRVGVTPSVLEVERGERGASRAVVLRGRDGERFRVTWAATGPVKWGKTSVEERPLGGWMVRVEGIDAEGDGERFLEISTDMPGMETIRVPLRVREDDEPGDQR